ncbi:hypothetical protein ABB37_03295 [Leptomonas pyrrhocoris]|uniref:Uncharacterized protein n=1 Tax=Leptomonas pyrrhocoris TaxID=157538 RepID=A0A0M9G4V5_LEPPY|nr:hypothetical protein ABB37_03295 [Leptomonas pyrrhocoris]KPA82166.1 hypothetical protein ABB37_03295 [Leptomonas pyrrhocoris]|eukprot:XP_015660605.1 hypothetical protein ABB37_03295 [Leptomonas pyrrhocoris]
MMIGSSSAQRECEESISPQMSPTSVANPSPVPRKRQRSSTPSDAFSAPSASLPVAPSAEDAEWIAAREKFAAAQWRRGCLRLPFNDKPFVKDTPKSRLGNHPRSNNRDVVKAAWNCPTSTTATETPCISPNPWKLLRAVEAHTDTERAPVIQRLDPNGQRVNGSSSASDHEPPVPLSPQKWNAYWETYSQCCADELEDLALLLNAPSTDYRRVLLTLISTAVVTPLHSDSVDGVLQQPSTFVGDDSNGGRGQNGHQDSSNTRSSKSNSSSSRKLQDVPPLAPSTRSASLPALNSADERVEDARRSGSRAASVSSYSYSYSSYSSYSSSSSSLDDDNAAQPNDTDTMKFPALSTVLDDLIFAHVHHFGAVECIETRHSNVVTGRAAHTFVSVQFTTAEAAGLFYRWADGLSVENLVRSYWRYRRTLRSTEQQATSTGERNSVNESAATRTEQRSHLLRMSPENTTENDTIMQQRAVHEDLWWEAFVTRVSDARFQLVAKLAPHDPRVRTTRLLIGPNVMIATPLVTSLFTGLFHATHVEFDRTLRGFLINFADIDECRLALHALQCSLRAVFGITLSYR